MPFGGAESGHNPTERSKLGTTRSLLKEAAGIPVGLAIAGANRNDMKLVKATLASVPDEIDQKRRQGPGPHEMCMDKGCDFEEVRKLVAEFGSTAHIPVRGQTTQNLKKRLQAPEMGCRAHPLLDESFPPHSDPVGKEARKLSRTAPCCLCSYRPPESPVEIGSKQPLTQNDSRKVLPCFWIKTGPTPFYPQSRHALWRPLQTFRVFQQDGPRLQT